MNPIPTPTAFAYETIEYIPALSADDWRIWQFADDAINVWNYEPTVALVIQAVFVIILVVVFIMLLIKELNRIQNGE